MNRNAVYIVAALVGLLFVPLLAWIFRQVAIVVEDEEHVLLTRFGKLEEVIVEPGLRIFPSKIFPWVRTQVISMRRSFRVFEGVQVNDRSGTTVIVDLWIEFRVRDAAKSAYAVENWESALRSLVAHATSSILGTLSFTDILRNRTQLADKLRLEIAQESERWGVEVDLAFLRNVSLLPDVTRQVFESIAARLERARAELIEDGRVKVALHSAEVDVQVAKLVAEAKGQYPEAVGRALAALAANPVIHAAYTELYELSLLRPHRMVAFRGFGDGELRAADAAMLGVPTFSAADSTLAKSEA